MNSFHQLLLNVHLTLNQRILSQAAAIGLSPGQPKILEYLVDHEGSDQKNIAVHCRIEQATVGSVLTRMEAVGLIERKRHPGNRRSLYVYLTDKGRAAAQDVLQIFDVADRWAEQGLTEEENRQLKVLLNKVYSAMESGQSE